MFRAVGVDGGFNNFGGVAITNVYKTVGTGGCFAT
jgi:hypothetical protein